MDHISVKEKFVAFLLLLRIHSSFSEPVIMIFGALVAGLVDLTLIAIIFIIGLFYHIFGYVLNDYADMDVDKRSSEPKKNPLISGVISPRSALILAIGSGCVAVLLSIIFFSGIVPTILLLLTLLSIAIYNFSRRRFREISDIIIAGSLMFSFFYGASCVIYPWEVPIWIIGLIIFVGIVFVNGVEGALKDADHDFVSGGRSLAAILGVKVQGDRLIIPWKFRFFSFGLYAICVVLALFFIRQPEIASWYTVEIQLLIFTPLFVIITYGISRLVTIDYFLRSSIRKIYALINGTAGVLIFLLVMPIIGIVSTLILIIMPVSWYALCNVLLYGKPFQPGV